MSEQSVEMAKSALNRARPWRKGMSWWVVVLEGVIALGIGLYAMFMPTAGQQVVLLLAILMLVVNAERAWLGFSERIPPAVIAQRMMRAGIGLTIGVIIVMNAWQEFMTPTAALVILSLGWLFIGLVGLWEWVAVHKELGLGWGGLIMPTISLLFGLLMLGSRLTLGASLLQAVGILAVVGGVGLLIYGVFLYRQASAPQPAAVAVE
jgi:uncharacterized membrane protein HdeD (DUF308 family)